MDTASDILDYARINDAMPEVPTASGLIDSIGSVFGKVADFGFNVQKLQLETQARSQDVELAKLKNTLGFRTAVTQAETQSAIAGYQAQGAIAQAMKSAGISTGGGISMTMLLVVALGAYLVAKKG
jgi:hypothetical protein